LADLVVLVGLALAGLVVLALVVLALVGLVEDSHNLVAGIHSLVVGSRLVGLAVVDIPLVDLVEGIPFVDNQAFRVAQAFQVVQACLAGVDGQ